MRASKQFAFEEILEHSFRQRERLLYSYGYKHKAKYLAFARLLENRSTWQAVHDRLAFAILSANAPFEASVKALNYVMEHRGDVSPIDIQQWRMVPGKAEYLNELWTKVHHGNYIVWLKHDAESWHQYRLRLKWNYYKKTGIRGLGLCKASFAACLLYPLESDLACIDIHIQKHYLGNPGFRPLGEAAYLKVESKIRKFASDIGTGTFIAQWIIWDAIRGAGPNNHAIFPGSHEIEEA